jgi:hypothetical protein
VGVHGFVIVGVSEFHHDFARLVVDQTVNRDLPRGRGFRPIEPDHQATDLELLPRARFLEINGRLADDGEDLRIEADSVRHLGVGSQGPMTRPRELDLERAVSLARRSYADDGIAEIGADAASDGLDETVDLPGRRGILRGLTERIQGDRQHLGDLPFVGSFRRDGRTTGVCQARGDWRDDRDDESAGLCLPESGSADVVDRVRRLPAGIIGARVRRRAAQAAASIISLAFWTNVAPSSRGTLASARTGSASLRGCERVPGYLKNH